MKAKVVCIESATTYVDDEERITLRFEDADNGFSRIRLRRGVIDTTHALQLDDEIELTILPGAGIAEENEKRRKALRDSILSAKPQTAGRHES